MNAWLYLALGKLLNASANFMVKLGSARPTEDSPVGLVKSALTNGWVLAGMAAFVLAFLMYAKALHTLPLTIAYPVMTAVGFILLVGASTVLLHQAVNWSVIIGGLLVVGGIVVIAR